MYICWIQTHLFTPINTARLIKYVARHSLNLLVLLKSTLYGGNGYKIHNNSLNPETQKWAIPSRSGTRFCIYLLSYRSTARYRSFGELHFVWLWNRVCNRWLNTCNIHCSTPRGLADARGRLNVWIHTVEWLPPSRNMKRAEGVAT